MASSSETETYPWATEAEISSFGAYLHRSKRILVLCGAGLSAASGIPTFRGSGALWHNHKAASLSSPEVFEINPGLVWAYHASRRKMAIEATPNKGHVALAEMAHRKKGFVTLTQNIDGLSEKAKHPRDRLYPLHGSLLDIKCSNRSCGYIDKENRSNPILDALAESSDLSSYTPETIAIKLSSLSLNSSKPSDPKEEDPKKPKYERTPNPLEAILESLAPTVTPEMHKEVIPLSKLPRCPKCSSLLRPGVVWFGESLSQSQFDEINAWIDRERKLDLMMVVGTRAEVFPAARFVQTTKEKGARIAVINLDGSHLGGHHLRKQDWLFEGDAAEVLDVLFDGILQN